MNTKRLFFGVLAVAFLTLTAVSTTVIGEDTLETTTSIQKGKIKME
ncbi:hypothetical protein [Flagellimonas sp.]